MNKFIHLKTGKIYRQLACATDCTSARDGTGVIVYCPDDDEHDVFVREAQEFEEKFKLLDENE
ncbi:MAG: hypothetical protein ABL903_21075 [Methylococcales bacterium]